MNTASYGAAIGADVTVAAVQMVSGPEVDANLFSAEALIAKAAAAGAKLVALPEYFAVLSADPTRKIGLREKEGDGPLQQFLSDCARNYGVWLVGGTIPLWCEDPARVRNTSLVFDPQGQRASRYDKLHLFSFRNGAEQFDEGATIECGCDVIKFDGPCGPTGLSVCYDLRFPELFRQLGDVNLIVLPAAFTATTGRAHWEVLLRARAIENQCYVLAAAQGGTHEGGRRTYGHSMLIDPWGTVTQCLANGEGIITGQVSPARIAQVRSQLPALTHRKLI